MTTFQKIMHTIDYIADGMSDIMRTGKFNDKILSFDTEQARSNYNVYKSKWNTTNKSENKQKENKVKSINGKSPDKPGFIKSLVNNLVFEPAENKRQRDLKVKKLEQYYQQKNTQKEVKKEKEVEKPEKNTSIFKSVNNEMARIAQPQTKSLHHLANAELHKISAMHEQARENDKGRTPGEQFVMKHGIQDEKQIQALGKRADDYIVEGHEKIENFTNRSGMDKGLDMTERSQKQTEKNAPDHQQQMEM